MIFSQISSCISETVIVRWPHAARQFVSIEFSFHPCNILRDSRRGVSRENKNVGCGMKTAIFNCCKLHNFITVVNYTIFAAIIDSFMSN